jgi:ElaB/YqjD/DUF883 family membrane-anchored ribosome-binding protein
MVQKKQTQKEPELDAPPSPRELVESLKEMIDEAESMIIETASHQMDETVEELREQLQERIDRLKASYQQAEERVIGVATATDTTIRQKPYQSLGMAAGIGVIIGLLLNRRH